MTTKNFAQAARRLKDEDNALQAEQPAAGVVPVVVIGAPVQFRPRGPRGWCPALVTAVEGDGRISLVTFRHDFGAAEWHASVPYGSSVSTSGEAAETYWRSLGDALSESHGGEVF